MGTRRPKKANSEPEKGVLVGSGGFGVDSRRAVKVLRARQLGVASEAAPLLWVRLAVRSGATRAVLLWEPGRFEARFDGAALPPVALSRPYDAYLGAIEGTPVMRLFGLALLHLSRPGVTVEVATGAADDRRAIYLEGPGAAPPRSLADGFDETVVRAFWTPPAKVPEGHPEGWDLRALGERLDAAPVPVTLGHRGQVRVLPPWGRRFGREAWVGDADGFRAGMHVLCDEKAASSLQLCVDGVSVEEESPGGLPLPLDGWVDAPELGLNASLDRVVKGPARERARAALRGAARDATTAALARHRRRMSLVSEALRRDPELRRHWEKALDRGEPSCGTARERLEAASGRFRGPSGDELLLIDVALWAGAWRGALKRARAKGFAPDMKDFEKALEEVPLLFDEDFRPLPFRERARAAALSRDDAGFMRLK